MAITRAALRNSAVGDLQSLINNRERRAQFLLRDTQWGIREEGIPTHECVEPFRYKILAERLHFRRGAVEWRQRLKSFRVSHQLHDSKETNIACRTHRPVTSLQIFQQATHHRPHAARSLNKIIFFIYGDGCQCRGTGKWVAVVSQTTIEDLLLKMLCDLRPHAYRTQLYVRA